MTGLCSPTGPPHPAAPLLWPLTQLWKVTNESHELSQTRVCRGCWESALAGPGWCPKGREQVPKWRPLWPSLGSSTVLVPLCDRGPREIGLTGCQLYISSSPSPSPAFLGCGFSSRIQLFLFLLSFPCVSAFFSAQVLNSVDGCWSILFSFLSGQLVINVLLNQCRDFGWSKDAPAF